MKRRWKPVLCLVTAVALAWALWYARPVDIYILAPEIRDPKGITIDVEELTNVGQEPRLCSSPFTPENPEWETALSQIESLRFRRPVSNAVLQFLDQRSSPLYGFQTGDYAAQIRVMGRDGSQLWLHFAAGSWHYTSPRCSSRHLPLKIQNGAEVGLALCREYWSPPETPKERREPPNVSRETLTRY